MSTLPTLASFEFVNVGPLTTTWTAPASCTALPTIFSAVGNLGSPGSFMFPPLGDCEESNSTDLIVDCLPNGQKVLETYPESETNELYNNKFYFYSPGLHCPDSWETAGIFAVNNGSTTASGVFGSTVFHLWEDETTDLPPANFPANALTSELAPTETAVACCPSGFSVIPELGCFSSFPATELAGETGCINMYGGDDIEVETAVEVFEYFGATITNTVQRIMAASTGTRSLIRTPMTLNDDGLPTASGHFPPYETGMPGRAFANFVYLVNSGNEGSEEKEEGSGDNEDGEEAEAEESAGGDDESAARALMATNSWAAIGAMAAVWAFGLAAGGGLIATW